MAPGRCPGVQAHPAALLEVTRVTLDALLRLVPPCEVACHAHREAPRRPREAVLTGACPPARRRGGGQTSSAASRV